jgi:hypothetical protein
MLVEHIFILIYPTKSDFKDDGKVSPTQYLHIGIFWDTTRINE